MRTGFIEHVNITVSQPERSAQLLADPPPAKIYQPGTWGPNAIHQLIAPNAWRLPFERAWREARHDDCD